MHDVQQPFHACCGLCSSTYTIYIPLRRLTLEWAFYTNGRDRQLWNDMFSFFVFSQFDCCINAHLYFHSCCGFITQIAVLQQLTVLVWFGAVWSTELWVHRRTASGTCFRAGETCHTDKKTCRKPYSRCMKDTEPLNIWGEFFLHYSVSMVACVKKYSLAVVFCTKFWRSHSFN